MIKTPEVMPALSIFIAVKLTTLVRALLNLCSGQSLLNSYIPGRIIVDGSGIAFCIEFLRQFNVSITGQKFSQMCNSGLVVSITPKQAYVR